MGFLFSVRSDIYHQRFFAQARTAPTMCREYHRIEKRKQIGNKSGCDISDTTQHEEITNTQSKTNALQEGKKKQTYGIAMRCPAARAASTLAAAGATILFYYLKRRMERSKKSEEASPTEQTRARRGCCSDARTNPATRFSSLMLYITLCIGIGERSDRQGPSSLATRHDRAASKNPVWNVVGKRGQKLETGLMLFAANSKNHDCGFFFFFSFFVFRRNPNLRVAP